MPQYPPPAAHASASITISWNTKAKPTPAPSHAPVASVHGTTVTGRLSDGTTRRYVASTQEAAVLRALVGQTIAFRVDSKR
jgi:hypothetical protein